MYNIWQNILLISNHAQIAQNILLLYDMQIFNVHGKTDKWPAQSTALKLEAN